MRIFRAIAILSAYLFLLILGMPGLDFLPPGNLQSERAQKEFRQQYGAVRAHFAVVASDLNRVRLKAENSIGKLQPVFRIAQSWHLFRDGPRAIRKLEIQVDRVPVYRTLDPNLTWMQPILRNRRIRPVVESFVGKPKAVNRWGLARLIVDRARADFPKIQRVDIVTMSGPLPGDDLRRQLRFVAKAPEWKLVEQR